MSTTTPNIINIDLCREIPETYKYVAVYSGTKESPHENRLRLLYDLRDHTGDEIMNREMEHVWTDHWSAFASRINDHWELKGAGGYGILAFTNLEGLKETYTSDEFAAFPHESTLGFAKQ